MSMVECESILDDSEREVALFQIYNKMNKCIEVESRKLKDTIIGARLKTKRYLEKNGIMKNINILILMSIMRIRMIL